MVRKEGGEEKKQILQFSTVFFFCPYEYYYNKLTTKSLKLCQEPEVLLPPGADEVATHVFALFPDSNGQALCVVDALLHKPLGAAGST